MKVIRKVLSVTSMVAMAGMLMGNQSCEKDVAKAEKRELRRRAQMGSIDAPQMPLPNGGVFDFKFAANAQLYDVLRTTKSFSSATIDPEAIYNPDELSNTDRDLFYACSETSAGGLDLMGKMSGSQKTIISRDAACMIDMPQAVVSGEIFNFQVTSTKGISVDIPQWANLGVDFQVKKAKLSIGMTAEHPLLVGGPNGRHVLASTTDTANSYERDIKAGIDLGIFRLGPRYYYTSDLGKVVREAMEKGITNLKDQMNQAEQFDSDRLTPWHAMVLKDCDVGLLINAGGASDAGLKVGDVLEVYNVSYRWQGEACQSQLMGTMVEDLGKPLAVATVDVVGDTFSRARITERMDAQIFPGARVYVQKLTAEQVAAKKKKK